MNKICPVCKTELIEDISKCPTCGFNELNKDFISPEDAQAWFERVVVPFREEWESNSINLKDFEIDGTTLVRYKGTSNKVDIPSGVTRIGDFAFQDCKSLTEITIPNSVTSIFSEAFSGCKSLTEITIPEGVTYILSDHFYSCTSLENIYVDKNNSHFISIDGVLFERGWYTGLLIDKSRTILICCPRAKKGKYNIPVGVNGIGRYAFQNCNSLTEITIPESVTSIGTGAFSKCTSLTEISIPEGVTSIGDFAFQDCKSLTEITIPNSMTSIGDFAFWPCSSLKKIILHSPLDLGIGSFPMNAQIIRNY